MSPIKRFLCILALTAMWSPSFLFIKLAVTEIEPISVVFFRVTLASLLIGALLLLKKQPLPKDIWFWIHSAIMAFLASVLPFYLFCYAEQSIDSALAAILNATTPMFTATLAHYFVPSDRLKIHKIIGILISATGLFFLFLPNITAGLSGSSLGLLAGTLAAICYSASHVYAKKFLVKQAPFVAPASQLILSSLMLLPFAFYFESPLQMDIPSWKALAGVGGLAFFGTFLAFIIYYKLLEHCGPTAVSMCACFFPVGGMLLGFLFLGERMSIEALAASALILIGIMIVNEVIAIKRTKSQVSVKQ